LFHSAWQAPDGRFAVVLANWTAQAQKAVIREPRLGDSAAVCISSKKISRERQNVIRTRLEVAVPPLSAMLLVRG
jgi:hypothetical protein